MDKKILVEELQAGRIIRITLQAPRGNILDSGMLTELQEALEWTGAQPRVRLLQFTGAGEHFSFGASVPEHTREQAGNLLPQFHRLFRTLMEVSIPTAALISGQCLGGGLELALMCNFLFADQSARLGQPEINLGVFAPPASLILPLKVGQTRADELLLTGRIVTAEEARDLGLLTELFPDRKSMLAQVEAWSEKYLLGKSAAALKHAVRAARWIYHTQLRTHLQDLEQYYLQQLMATHDANEGIAAFMERRKPRWEDR